MKIFRAIYSLYCLLVFVAFFLILFFPLMIPVLFPRQHHLVGLFNRWWARCIFFFWFMPVRVEYRAPLDPKKQYIFCPNHFSYIDIPAVGLNKVSAIFVGKNALEKIPLFGFMYRKLHITVDRKKLKSRSDSIKRSLQAIDDGKSLVLYPEGGIRSKHPPQLAPFKDGAMRIAIEKQIPVVPVTIPNNWIILPVTSLLIRWRPVEIIFHEPLITTGLGAEDIPELKNRVATILDTELKKHFPHGDQPRTA